MYSQFPMPFLDSDYSVFLSASLVVSNFPCFHVVVSTSQVLAIVMLGPRSYTCEDVVEIHAHGGGVCARRVLTACLEAGATLAKPGEFTLRAFLNGRLDLTQVPANL